MTIIDFLTYTSLAVGVMSLAVSTFAIWFAKQSERESRENFNKTRDLLAEINKQSALIERTVSDSQKDLMSTLTNIVNQTIIPTKPDMGEQLGLMLFQQIAQNPEGGTEMLEKLMDFAQRQNEIQNQK